MTIFINILLTLHTYGSITHVITPIQLTLVDLPARS